MMYPLVRELAARGAPIRVPVTVEYDKPIWPHCAALIWPHPGC